MKRLHYLIIAGAVAAGASIVPHPVVETHGGRRHEAVTLLAARPIPNVPGKRMVTILVDYPPGADSVPHRHAKSAFIYAYVLSGEIRSVVEGEPVRVYRKGEWWFESPGAHHLVSANASRIRAAQLLAVFIVDGAESELTTPDLE